MEGGDVQHVQQLELMCKQLYAGCGNGNERAAAEKQLVAFQSSCDAHTLLKCQQLLERADSPYAQMLAATTLTRLVTRNGRAAAAAAPVVTAAQRLDIRNYVLNYLATRPKMAPFVVQALVTLFGRLTKLGWFDASKDELAFKNVIKDVTVFLQGSVEHCTMGVHILAQLTSEMNTVVEPDAVRWLNRHRKTAASFRDTCLYEVFQMSCQLLRTALNNCKNVNINDESQHGLLSQLLKLSQNCLMFDFMGTYTDESSDDSSTVQIPTSWRPVFLDADTPKLFFELYNTLSHSLSSMALCCLVQIASVRRSLFNNMERAKFLNHMVLGVKGILQNPQGLTDAGNYHEFCRLLARLKSNFQLGELVMVDDYAQVIQLIANFTVQSLQMWQFAPNSVHYLLSLWQRLVASVPYVKASEPHLLDTYTPAVTKAYISSRIDSAAVVVRDGLEDPMDELGMVQQQLDQLSAIGRCDYKSTCQLLVTLFDETAQKYQQAISSADKLELLVTQGQLTWLVYLIGSAIGGRMSFNTNDEHDTMDGELICRVLQLMNVTDSQLHQGGCEKLELAIISFFEQFRKIYVGDQKTAKVYSRLSEVVGISDDSAVLSVFMRKIITNLKYWSASERITSRTLLLLGELSVGYSCVRKLVKLEEVQFLLANHTSEQFPFLGGAVAAKQMKCRTVFYTALGRLLMAELAEDDDKFDTFIQPLSAAFNSVGTVMSADPNCFQRDDTKKALIGLARDLRGLAFAFNTKQSYMQLFGWLHPAYTELLQRAVQLWSCDNQLTTPVLKLFAELTLNRSQRLQFDVSSPNGILLFREMSKLLCTFGERMLTLTDVPKDRVYSMRLKGVCVGFTMLKAALCGNYVNFGAFRLYGDQALDDALQMFVKFMLSIPQADLLDYPKLSQAYYVLLECVCQDHMAFMTSLGPQVFLFVFATISDGLQALDTMVCTGCCTTLDNIVTFAFKQLSQKGKKKVCGGDAVLQIIERQPEVLQQLLATVLNIVMMEDGRNQWSMSRPLLGLILLNEEYFGVLRDQIVANCRVERQAVVRGAFVALMDGVECNLLVKNRDRFTQNLTTFRRDVDNPARSHIQSGSGVSGDLSMMTSHTHSLW